MFLPQVEMPLLKSVKCDNCDLRFSVNHNCHKHVRRKEGRKGKRRGSKHDVITAGRQQFKGHSLCADPHSFLIKVGVKPIRTHCISKTESLFFTKQTDCGGICPGSFQCVYRYLGNLVDVSLSLWPESLTDKSLRKLFSFNCGDKWKQIWLQ